MHYLRRSLKYLWPFWRLAVASGMLIVLASLADLAGAWPLKVLFDSVFGTIALPNWIGSFFRQPIDRVHLLWVVIVAYLVIALTENLLNVLTNYAETLLEQRMVLQFRADLFEHSQRLSLAFHDRKRSGMLIYIINSQGDAAAALIMTVPTLARSVITLIGMFWILMHMDKGIAMLALLVLPFLFYAVRYYATRIQDKLLAVRGMEGESLSIIHEAISMLRVIVAFGREAHEHRRFVEQGTRAVNARVGVTVRQTLFSMAVNMTTATGKAAVLALGAYSVLKGILLPGEAAKHMTAGELIVVLSYIDLVYKPLEAITYTIGTLQEKFMSLKLAFGVIDTVPEVRDPPHPKTLENVRGKVVFEDVDFAYEGRQDTLRGISFEARAGQTVAIVGPTGAGKTTLISLLPRFYDPLQGKILIDDVGINELSLATLRAQISLVLQEPLLFSGTIADNIRYGRLEADDDELIAAAQAANAHEFIMRLPQQYKTELGERGAQLSGGERQRICVARAFLKNAPLLILDEPTSSIDSKTESVILDALDRLMDGRTSFMIAHRLSTVRRADLILVMDRGKLVQQGTHDKLVDCEGLYRQLYEMQTRQRTSKKRAAATPAPAAASPYNRDEGQG